MPKGIRISLNFDAVAEEVHMSRREVEMMSKNVIMEVTVAILNAWKAVARKELHSTRNSYLRGLQIIESGKFATAIVLNGNLNNMLESGAGAYDMKDSFRNSPKKKISADGNWYIRIPFRFAAPSSLGESEAFSGVLPQAVYNLVKNQKSARTTPTGAKKSGDTLKAINIPREFAIPKSRAALTNMATKRTFDEYTHKSSIYEGIGKSSKEYEGGTGSKYGNFRTVGELSDKNAFIHPGFIAGNFAEKGIKIANLDAVVENSIDNYLTNR